MEIDTNEEKCIYCNSLNIVRNGSRKTEIENKQRFKCKDCGKRFILDPIKILIANNVTRGREITDARKVLRIAKDNIKENPKEIVNDGLWSYKRAIRKEFVTKRTSPNAVLHLRNAGIAKKVERYHNELENLTK